MKQNEFHNNKIYELEKASQNDSNLFWKIPKNILDDLDDKTNPENSPKESDWFSHFKHLHSEHRLAQEQKAITETLKQKENSKNLFTELDTKITVEEIMKAAKKIKSKKAAYSDRISNKMMKHSADILANCFTKMFNTILNLGKFPSS